MCFVSQRISSYFCDLWHALLVGTKVMFLGNTYGFTGISGWKVVQDQEL